MISGRAGRIALLLALLADPGRAEVDAGGPPALRGLDAFVAAYPEHLLGVEEGHLVWRDGTRMPLEDLGVEDETRVHTVALPPPEDPAHAATEAVAAVHYGPIYYKMYGDCRADEVSRRLVPLRWNRGAPDGGRVVMATGVNGVAARLQRVSDELDRLGPEFRTYLRPLGGTYMCRNIALSNRQSLHGFGIAVDINPSHGDYWITAPRGEDGAPRRRNRIPLEIVHVFEAHGFVWGGRWHRFDTFHFEYRPEFAIALGGPFPERLTSTRFVAGRRAERVAARSGALGAAAMARMGFGPRFNAVRCTRWVRQPGPRFGQCVSGARSAQRTQPGTVQR
jgi:hypothetical protein